MQRKPTVFSFAWIALPILSVWCVSAFADSAPLTFNRDIRPILAENCFACHGHDDQKRKGELRLDLAEATRKPAKSGALAIVPNRPFESELVKRITAADPDDRMPPATSGKHLSPAQIDLLKLWISQGAPYQIHWAFVPPVRPALPNVKNSDNAKHPIDQFILARLATEGLAASPPAEKVTLLRRLYLDLIGLPPTPEQVDEYLKDPSADAYERQVEKLLASPHYGERWGRYWLDAARYADSDGFEKDKPRSMFFYRDYVMGALNRDLPYNQFIIEQLAGDLLPHPTQDQIVATGFLRNSMVNEEGGVDPEQFRMDEMFDRIDAIGKGVLGLTVQCAQCHSHKFDPFTQEEYYRLFAFLNNDHESQRIVYTPDQQMKIADLRRQIREIEGGLRHEMPDWQSRLNAWEDSVKDNQPAWQILDVEDLGDKDQRYIPQADGSYLAQGYAPTKFTVTFRTKSKVDLKDITAFRLELLTDPNLPCGGPGRSFKGTCALTDFSAEVAPADQPEKRTKVKFSGVTADYDQPERELEPNFYDKTKNRRVTGPVKYALDGNPNTAWGIDAGPGLRNQDRKAVFTCATPVGFEQGTIITIHLQQNHGGWNSDDLMNNNLGRFRLSVTSAQGPIVADPLPRHVREILAVPREQRNPNQTAEVFSYWRTTLESWKDANDQIAKLWEQWPAGATTLTLTARDDSRETHILARGDWLKPTKAVTPGVPAFLNPLPKNARADRLTFANWLVDSKAPTTARVAVNRIWQAYFGTGIVATAEDFGTQGEPPSHPQLLDWLACEFMEPTELAGGENSLAAPWSIKHIQRLIVTSRTYRQSSRVTPETYARDPDNRLLARGPRFRMEAEIVHDVALAASGLLNPEMGGRSVMPPAPAFLFQPPASYAPFPWIEETGAEKYRRAIYTFRRRSTPYPALQTFDAPNGESSCVRRSRSNSPLQALVMLNEPIFVECAKALARKTLEAGGTTDEQRIDYAFGRVLSRPPTDLERTELLKLLNKERRRFAEGWSNPNDLVTVKPPASDETSTNVTPTQLAAYTLVSRTLLNLDETITKE